MYINGELSDRNGKLWSKHIEHCYVACILYKIRVRGKAYFGYVPDFIETIFINQYFGRGLL